MAAAARTPGVDELLAAAGIDPADGVQVVGVAGLAAVAFDPSLPLILLPGGGAAAGALPGRHARSGPRAVLGALYPLDHPLERLPGRELRRLGDLDDTSLATASWLVPPLDPIENLFDRQGVPGRRAFVGCLLS